ncbi:hypothetical protein FCV25MIE_29377 [Fagus crenata]
MKLLLSFQTPSLSRTILNRSLQLSVDAARGRAGKEARVTLFSPLKILNSGNLLLRQSTPLTRADSSLVIDSLKISDLVARSCDLGLGTWVVVGDGLLLWFMWWIYL